jgi:TP901 family phage tail tape measure protein
MAGRAPKITLVVAGDGSGAKKALEEVNQHFDQSEKKLGHYGKQVGAAMVAAGVAVAAGVIGSVKVFADYDAKLTESLAIMGDVSDAQRKDMSDAAREVAKTTKFSAGQVAESYYFLASAGLDAEKSINALPRVAAFAQAGMFDMALATDLLTDAQSALGLSSKDATESLENMNRVGDVLVKANTLANASVEQFSTALTNQAGAAMKSVNMDIEEGVAVLAAFADQGIKGEDAGTKFAIVLRDLQTKAIANKEAFAEAGVAVFDSAGELRNMSDIVGDLEGHLAGMSTEQKKAALATLGFTDKSVGALLALMGTSDAIQSYEEGLRNAGGTMDEVAQKQLQTFWAQVGLLKDQVLDLALGLGEKLMPHVMSFVSRLRDNMPVIEATVARFIDWAPALLNLVPALAGVAAGLVALKIGSFVTGVAGAVKAAGGLGAALTGALGPVGIIAMAVGVLTAALIYAYKESDTFRGIVQGVWAAISAAVEVAWEKVIGPALESLRAFVADTLGPAFGTFMAFLVEEVWPKISDAVKFAWEKVIQPAWAALVYYVENIFIPTWRLIFTVAKEVFEGVAGAVKTAWEDVIEPTWNAIMWAWENVLRPGFEDIRDVAQAVWGAVELAVDAAWKAIEPIWEDVKDFLRDTLGPALVWLRDDIAEPVWEAVEKAVDDAWTAIEPWLDALEKALEPVGTAFRAMKDAAVEAWNGVKGAVRGALSWLAGPLDKFLSVMQKIASAVKASNLASTIADARSGISGWLMSSSGGSSGGKALEFNRGGSVPGSGPNRDSVPAMLTPGEFVLNRDAAGLFRPSFLEWANRAGRSGIAAAARLGGDLGDIFQRLNAGGWAKAPDEVLKWAKTQEGPYQWAGYGPRYDCSGFMGALSDYAAVGRVVGRTWATGQATGKNQVGRFVPGVGDPASGFSIGIRPTGWGGQAIGHTAGTIAGVNVESSGSRGAHVGGARGYTYGPYRYHLPDYGGPSEEMKGWFSEIRGMLAALAKGLADPFSDMFRSLAGTIAKETAVNLVEQVPFGGILKKLAGLGYGGFVTRGGSLLVGERGPELVSLPGGSRVSPKDELASLLTEIRDHLKKDRGQTIIVSSERDVLEAARAARALGVV